ncbi:MAG: GHKL domain-containing protein, partial [Opitutaceae bacterium]|nr:GHKL domain-containing protein [Opitutaceae bacterium]
EYANEAGRRMIALKEADMDVATIWRFIPGLRASLDSADDEAIDSQTSLSREIELGYPEHRFIRLYMVPFQEDLAEGEDSRKAAVILSDITQEKISTEEMLESERVSSILMLAAGVAHELGNPLNSLSIHLEVMKRNLSKLAVAPEVERLSSSVEICQREVKRLDGIIRNFLEAIRPQIPDLHELDPLKVLDEVLAFYENELDDRGLSVKRENASEALVVLADKDQLKQVFFNVIKNAMEAMTKGGILSISSRSDDEFVYLQFGDTGHGISKENIGKVFQPYQSTKQDGHGLGMMIVDRIMRDHGGQIGIDSKEAVGTTVTLQFPSKNRRVRLLKD